MRLTAFGAKGVAFYVAMLVAFYATPYSNLFFLLLGFLTLLGLAGGVGAWRNGRGVHGSLERIEPVHAGDTIQIPVTLRAPKRGRFALDVRLALESDHEIAARVDLLDGEVNATLSSSELPRGIHAVRAAWVESSHPFGLARVRHALEAPDELVVYPLPLDLVDGRGAADSVEDLLGSGTPGAGDLQPSSLRDHREGDGMRDVHWRASARRGRLVVQEWEGGTGEGIEVVLDRRCSPAELERALSALSAIVGIARTNKETLRLLTQDLAATYGEGHEPWESALRFLAGAQSVPANGPAPPAASPGVTRLPDALGARPNVEVAA